MKCIRCGYCCISSDVIVVSPEYTDLINDTDEIEQHMLVHKPSYHQCPHLRFEENGITTCLIHHYPWYSDTPCAKHNTIFDDKRICNMGNYIFENNIDIKKFIKQNWSEYETD